MLCACLVRASRMKILNECGEKLLKPWFSVQNVLLGFSFFYVVALIVRVNYLKSSDLAAWVQAVGAVISIWAAWNIARQQSKRAQADSARADLAKCVAVAGVLRHALRAVDLEPAPGQGTVKVSELLDGIEKSISSLERIDVLSLPNADLVTAVFEATYSLQRLRISIKNEDRNFLIHNYYYFNLSARSRSLLEAQIEVCENVSGST